MEAPPVTARESEPPLLDPNVISRPLQVGSDAQLESESDARASIRTQIARLERRLALTSYELFVASLPGLAAVPPGRAAGSGRLLTLGELEVVRDELAVRARDAERVLTASAEVHQQARAHLEAMRADPATHKFERIPRVLLGEPGCGSYEVRPRLGLLGMLFGWWRVKLSSGCP